MDPLRGSPDLPGPPDADVRRRCEDLGVRVLEPRDADWPERLNHLTRPPRVLYVYGDVATLDRGGVAIVGSRRGTAYGRGVARDLGARAATGGDVVLSGMALGIDAAAHEGAIDAGRADACVAVLGSGPDVVTPRSNRRLYRALRDGGTVVSEYPPGTEARPWHFPARNRILAALAEEVVVVEAAERSGALGTARIALELGRDVRAVPGPIDRETSTGTNRLLADGAAPVVSVRDWWESRRQFGFRFGLDGPGENRPAATGVAGEILSALDAPADAGELAGRLDRPVESVLSALVELELTGRVERVDGGRVRRLG